MWTVEYFDDNWLIGRLDRRFDGSRCEVHGHFERGEQLLKPIYDQFPGRKPEKFGIINHSNWHAQLKNNQLKNPSIIS